MKKMFRKTTKVYIHSSVVLLVSLASFVLFTVSRVNAQTVGGDESTCKVTILSMEANPIDIYKNSQINFHTKIQRNGCAEVLDLNFEYYDGNIHKLTTCIDRPTHQEIIEFDCPYNFSQYPYWDELNNKLEYFLQVTSSRNLNYGNTRSWKKYFNVQLLGGSLTFTVLPQEPVFGQDLKISYSDFPFASSGKIYVNDDQHFVNVSSSGNVININQNNGFKTGENTIRIVLFNDNSGNKTFDIPYKVSVKAAAQPATQTFGCRAANGVYACTNNQNDANLKQACGSNFAQQPADKCGCTDAEYSAGVKSKDCKANGGTGKSSTPGSVFYGCKARDGSGIWACYDTYQKAIDAKCPQPINTVASAWCGKTDEQIKAAGGGGTKPTDTTVNEVLFNPLPVDSLTGTLLYIAKGFLAIIGLWGVVFIMIGGFKLVMAQGNEEAYLAAKKTITWAVLGVVVALLSFSIIAILQNLIGATVPPVPGGENPIIENTPK